MTPQPPSAHQQRPLWRRILPRLLFLALALAVLFFFLPTIYGFVDESEKLATVDWWWFVLMGLLMSGAFVAAWELNRIALLDVSRFVVATAQLVSNALSKVIPGGAVAAGATLFQMLSVSGIPRQQAATGLAAVAFISNLVLFSLPAVALLIAALSAPIPEGLLPVAVAGSVLFSVMFMVVVVLVKFDKEDEEARKQAHSKIGAIRTRIVDGTEFGDEASEHSDCPSGKQAGGSLGWFSHGMMVPEFDAAVFSMSVNELSEIIETDFGFHVVNKVGAEEESEASFDEVRDRVRDFLRHSSRGEILSTHVNELRQKAVIEED